MGFEKRHRTIMAQQDVLVLNRMPDKQAVERIVMVAGVWKTGECGEDIRVQWFFTQSNLGCGGGNFRRVGLRE